MTDQGTGGVPRPRSVTVVVLLTYLSGIFSIFAGLLVVLAASNTQAQEELGALRGVILAAGVFSVVIGLVTLLVARGLRHGRRAARLAVTVAMTLQIVGGTVTATGGQSQILSGVVQIVIAMAVLGLLWSGSARQFFRH